MSNPALTTPTVKPCIKCGASDRYKRGDCKYCARAYAKAKWPSIKDSENAKKSKRYADNPELAKAYFAAWRRANPEKVRATVANWAKANPEARRIRGQNRRARKEKAGGTLSRGLAKKLFELQKGRCPCCKQALGDDYHLDHKMPLALGGSNTDDNMQLLRAICNGQKHAKHPGDFMRERGFLL